MARGRGIVTSGLMETLKPCKKKKSIKHFLKIRINKEKREWFVSFCFWRVIRVLLQF